MSAGGHIIRNRIVLQAGVDLDTITIPGAYACESPTNGPSSGNFIVEVYVAVDAPTRYIIQRATKLSDATTSIRLYNGTVWSGSWSSVGGGGSGNAAVRAATTANITISTALNNGDTIDGVTLATDDLVLVKNQSSAAENGIYKVGVSPARQTGFTTFNAFPGLIVTVAEGTVNADTAWVCTSNAGGVIETNPLVFADLVLSRAVSRTGDTISSGGYAATSFAAGTKSSGTFTPDPLNGNFQHATNGGAHTLAPPSATCSITIEYTNNASAGAVTTSGFTFVSGDALTTTNGEKFLLFITKTQSFSHLQIQRLQ